jgi:hypothetical protein
MRKHYTHGARADTSIIARLGSIAPRPLGPMAVCSMVTVWIAEVGVRLMDDGSGHLEGK